MSLRLRLTFWYAALTGIVALLVGGVTYGAHVRARYEEVDRTILETVREYRSGSLVLDGNADPAIDPLTVVRIHDINGTVVASTPQSNYAPYVYPQQLLADDSDRPYDLLAGLVPIDTFSTGDSNGKFGLVDAPGNDRWRTYVVPLAYSGEYIVVTSPLSEIDASMSEFRRLVLGLLIVGGLVTIAGGWLLASSALQPVNAVTETANALAESRTLNRRVPVGRDDEVGRLAATFNRMLDNLDEAYELQRRFVADASHELRAPLTAIHSNLELLERRPELSSEVQRDAIQEANLEARRLKRLVNDLLALARADAGINLSLNPVELDRVVLEALRECQALCDGQELRIDELEPVMVRGDADRLKQLGIILLDNAVRYTPPEGTVTVSVTRNENSAHFSVRDTGVGIAAEDLPHVFERFYRADPARSRDPGGTGLGLSIAEWIVEQHGGEIRVESQSRSGTVAAVRLPI